jgi:hypothetical protein
MKRFFSIAILSLGLMAGAASAAQVVVRVAPPVPVREVVTVRPGPGYVWIPGYYEAMGPRRIWVAGYWALPPQPRAVWAPGNYAYRAHGRVVVRGHWR